MLARYTRTLMFLPFLASAAVIVTGCHTQASLEIRYQQGVSRNLQSRPPPLLHDGRPIDRSGSFSAQQAEGLRCSS